MKFAVMLLSLLVVGSTSYFLRHQMRQRQKLLNQMEKLQQRHQVLHKGGSALVVCSSVQLRSPVCTCVKIADQY